MARFDIRRLATKTTFDLVVELQSDAFESLDTRIVAPLVEPSKLRALTVINPVFHVRRKQYALIVHQMLSLSQSRLGEKIDSLSAHEYEITRALDHLLSRS